MRGHGKWVQILGIFLVLSIATPLVAGDNDWIVRTRLLFISPDDDASGALSGLSAEVESDVTVEVDAACFLNDHFAIEGILATAAQEVTINPGMGRESLGSVYHAPATVLGQYHFKTEGKARPYVGAGLNYTIFYSESGALADLKLDSGSFGLAGQVGVDIEVGDDKVINFDLKHIQIETDVKDTGMSLGTVEVNPWIFGVGFGFRI